MRKIAIICGGYSGEYEISINSAKVVKKNLDSTLYDSYLIVIKKGDWFCLTDDDKHIPVDKNDFSIIYDGAKNLAPNLIAEDGSVGIRVTSEEFSNQLCYRFRKAIVSTSANVSGEPSPATFGEISDEIKQAVDYIVQSRQQESKASQSSSIIKLGKGGQVKVIRE